MYIQTFFNHPIRIKLRGQRTFFHDDLTVSECPSFFQRDSMASRSHRWLSLVYYSICLQQQIVVSNHSSVGRAEDCSKWQTSLGRWFESGWLEVALLYCTRNVASLCAIQLPEDVAALYSQTFFPPSDSDQPPWIRHIFTRRLDSFAKLWFFSTRQHGFSFSSLAVALLLSHLLAATNHIVQPYLSW